MQRRSFANRSEDIWVGMKHVLMKGMKEVWFDVEYGDDFILWTDFGFSAESSYYDDPR